MKRKFLLLLMLLVFVFSFCLDAKADSDSPYDEYYNSCVDEDDVTQECDLGEDIIFSLTGEDIDAGEYSACYFSIDSKKE